MTLLTLDRIFHFFWRYYDKNDPIQPRRSKYSAAIEAFHLFLDGRVRKLVRSAGTGATFLIVSDHGHGMRPISHFNVNELLLEKGLLKSRITGPTVISPRYHIDRAKNIALETLHRLDMEDLSYRVAHVFPWTRKLKRGDFMTERSEKLATASEFGGNNPFGGIDVSRERCSAENIDYEKLRSTIIAFLAEAKDLGSRPVFLWARRREEMFHGPYVEKFPDILYEMRPEYGTNWSLYRPLITVNPRHRKISGGTGGAGFRSPVLSAHGSCGENSSRHSISPPPSSLSSPRTPPTMGRLPYPKERRVEVSSRNIDTSAFVL